MKIIHLHGQHEIVSKLNYPHLINVLEARESFLRAEAAEDDPGQGGGVREPSETLEQPDSAVVERILCTNVVFLEHRAWVVREFGPDALMPVL